MSKARKYAGERRDISADSTSNAIGVVDVVQNRNVHGWAISPISPTARLRLSVVVDGSEVATCIADKFREDLVGYFNGDGFHGFDFELPKVLFDDRTQDILLFSEETGQLLFTESQHYFDKRVQSGVIGVIDGVAVGQLFGWVHDKDAPELRVIVRVEVDGREIAQALCNIFRPDLAEVSVGDGFCGFNVFLPEDLLDGGSHTYSIYNNLNGQFVASHGPVSVDKLKIQDFSTSMSEYYILFDNEHYRSNVLLLDFEVQKAAGVERALQDPLGHYLDVGWKHEINPHPLFDTLFYKKLYGHLFEGNPLEHFFAVGCLNTFETHPLFDAKGYCERRPDVSASGIHPLLHYLRHGKTEPGFCSDFFDEDYYTACYPGVSDTGFLPLVHYLTFGWREGLRPNASFDGAAFTVASGVSIFGDPFTYFARTLIVENKLQTLTTDAGVPEVSVIILNLGKSLMTLQCLFHLKRTSFNIHTEVIIVDNGSDVEQYDLLVRMAGNDRLVRLETNRGFGEGNNIGAGIAKGEFLLFLNNDAFVTSSTLFELLKAFEVGPNVGAVGPKFLYPDGRLQEAGAMVSPCGIAVQRGKHLAGGYKAYDSQGPAVVDYCSAACLLVKRKTFNDILGFDLCWDPAYYEDTDLCLKLRVVGLDTLYVPKAIVFHFENTTSSDGLLNLRLGNIVEINRLKFVSRWGDFLSGQSDGTAEKALVHRHAMRPLPQHRKRLGVYTPYPLTPGGGERYLLSIVALLAEEYECTLLTPERYSTLRLATLARELELDLDDLRHEKLDEHNVANPFDIFILMGNELLPSVAGRGKLNLFHCQFPFPMTKLQSISYRVNLASYHALIVNSEFTRRHVNSAMRRQQLPAIPVHVVHPPVPQVVYPRQARAPEKPLIILNVGRFAPGGHCKRQDIMIDQFRLVYASSSAPIELHLVGALGQDADARDYFSALQRQAQGLPVHFHVNISPSKIHKLYGEASFYWHVTGINDKVLLHPEKFEHFGITIVEAMSAGVVPIVLRFGGPSEIIACGANGFLISTAGELSSKTNELLELAIEELAEISESARVRAKEFTAQIFAERLRFVITDGAGSYAKNHLI